MSDASDGSDEPLTAARIGFFVGGVAGLALVLSDVASGLFLWIPCGAIFTLFLVSRRAPVDLFTGMKGGAACGLMAAFVFLAYTELQVVRSPAGFAHDFRRALPDEKLDWSDTEKETRQALLDWLTNMEKLAQIQPVRAAFSWLFLLLLPSAVLAGAGIVGGIFGVLFFRGKAPPVDQDASD